MNTIKALAVSAITGTAIFTAAEVLVPLAHGPRLKMPLAAKTVATITHPFEKDPNIRPLIKEAVRDAQNGDFDLARESLLHAFRKTYHTKNILENAELNLAINYTKQEEKFLKTIDQNPHVSLMEKSDMGVNISKNFISKSNAYRAYYGNTHLSSAKNQAMSIKRFTRQSEEAHSEEALAEANAWKHIKKMTKEEFHNLSKQLSTGELVASIIGALAVLTLPIYVIMLLINRLLCGEDVTIKLSQTTPVTYDGGVRMGGEIIRERVIHLNKKYRQSKK